MNGNSVASEDVTNYTHYKATYQDNVLLSLSKVDSIGTVVEKNTFFYDRYGNLLETKKYNEKGSLLTRTKYLPDDIQKNLIEKIYGRHWTISIKDFYTKTEYDTSGKAKIHEVFSVTGELIGGLELHYDNSGYREQETWFKSKDRNVLEYTLFSFSPEDSIQTVEQYDGRGNLISSVKIRIPR